MNGDERRRNDIYHPETTLTSLEKEKKTQILIGLLIICNAICFITMIIGIFIVVILASKYQGIAGFSITLIGILINILIGLLMAHRIGNKITKKIQER